MLICAAMHAPVPYRLPPDLLLLAYRSGVFPMADSREDEELFWVEPRQRAVFPLENFHLSRSLAKAVRQDRFRVTLDTAFSQVIEACSRPRKDHPETWISARIQQSYVGLFEAGHAHSVECWLDDRLVGGLYGVSFDRVFCGESMFSTETDASKVALAWLVALMRRAGHILLDCQFMTEHLASLGAVEISRDSYLMKLSEAADGPAAGSLRDAYFALLRETGDSSPGKRIAQDFTHTS